MKITFIGGGNMAFALVNGLIQQGYTAAQINFIEIDAERCRMIKEQFGINAVTTLSDGIEPVKQGENNVIVLAVKPQQMHGLTQQMAGKLDQHLVISIAAGIQATDLMRWLGGYPRVVRAMPNTPALVGAGVTGLYAAPEASEMDRRSASTIMEAVGTVLWVDEEEMLHTVTAISGSGPAYVFYFIESMQQAAIELGLTQNEARQLSLQTFQGAIKLANESDDDAAVLRARVTSRGGTTEQAIESMEVSEVKRRIIAAIHTANKRSREMSDEFGKL